jgi:hypothetical protein
MFPSPFSCEHQSWRFRTNAKVLGIDGDNGEEGMSSANGGLGISEARTGKRERWIASTARPESYVPIVQVLNASSWAERLGYLKVA